MEEAKQLVTGIITILLSLSVVSLSVGGVLLYLKVQKGRSIASALIITLFVLPLVLAIFPFAVLTAGGVGTWLARHAPMPDTPENNAVRMAIEDPDGAAEALVDRVWPNSGGAISPWATTTPSSASAGDQGGTSTTWLPQATLPPAESSGQSAPSAYEEESACRQVQPSPTPAPPVLPQDEETRRSCLLAEWGNWGMSSLTDQNQLAAMIPAGVACELETDLGVGFLTPNKFYLVCNAIGVYHYPIAKDLGESLRKNGLVWGTGTWPEGCFVQPTRVPWTPQPTCTLIPTHTPTPTPTNTSTAAVPVASSTPVGSSGETTTHTVTQGETLNQIAKRYGVSVEAIVTANNLTNANVIYVGQELTIPPSGE